MHALGKCFGLRRRRRRLRLFPFLTSTLSTREVVPHPSRKLYKRLEDRQVVPHPSGKSDKLLEDMRSCSPPQLHVIFLSQAGPNKRWGAVHHVKQSRIVTRTFFGLSKQKTVNTFSLQTYGCFMKLFESCCQTTNDFFKYAAETFLGCLGPSPTNAGPTMAYVGPTLPNNKLYNHSYTTSYQIPITFPTPRGGLPLAR